MNRLVLVVSVAACTLMGAAPHALAPRFQALGNNRSLAPFVASPMDVVDRMLTLAKVGPGDVVYDLGCGDGRIVIAAAQSSARGALVSTSMHG